MKSSRAANSTARSIRTGSSRKRMSGSPMTRMHPVLEVGEAADVVDDREAGDVVEEAVDGEVAPQRVLDRRPEDVVLADQQVARLPLLRLGAAAEGRDLHDLPAVEEDVGEAEAAADDPAVAEEPADLRRVGVGADVEVLGLAPEEQVAHRPADQVGLEAGLVEAVEHLQDVGVDAGAADRMPGAIEDYGGGHVFGVRCRPSGGGTSSRTHRSGARGLQPEILHQPFSEL